MRRLFAFNTLFNKRLFLWGSGLALVVMVLAGRLAGSAIAAPLPQPESAPLASNNDCLVCHGKPDMVMDVGNQQVLLTVNADLFSHSLHGQNRLLCVDCHIDMGAYPHPGYPTGGVREFQYAIYKVTQMGCERCHATETEKAMSGVHQQTLYAGNHNAAMCADCHYPHYVEAVVGREEVPDVCARCHNDIAATYKSSVHGAALVGYGNPDVPNCIVCHGNHDIQDPRTVEFRNNIPLLCAKCHTDIDIMKKYGISTNVLNTYVSDYHGTTVAIFEQSSPNLPTNKPVCTDCHGVHDIARTNAAKTGIKLKENLLKKCQRCHPDATANFPDAWMSHYIASPSTYPLVYYVDLFYKIFIPLVIGGMLIFVLSDMIRRLINRMKGGTHE